MATTQDFEQFVQPCLDAGFNLARWLLHDDAAAEDILQDAALRAFRFLGTLAGQDAKPWFLKIVRNACYTHMEVRKSRREHYGFEESELVSLQAAQGLAADDPAKLFEQRHTRLTVDAAIAALPPLMREVIVLREIEGLDYKDISAIAGIPMGTVMSRLSRARDQLRTVLSDKGLHH